MALFSKRTKVPTESLPKGHIILISSEGAITDLGPCDLEDLRLTAYVAQEAYNRLPAKRSRRVRTNTLGRVRSFTDTIYKKASGKLT